MKKQYLLVVGALALVTVSSGIIYFNQDKEMKVAPNLDEAILSIIKNDEKTFQNFIALGGSIKSEFELDKKKTSLVELIVQYERIGFLKSAGVIELREDKDFWRSIVEKNNSKLLELVKKMMEPVELNKFQYDNLERHLLHVSSIKCYNEVVPVLEKSNMQWSDLDKKGASALTLAAENGCLNILSYWKLQKADFHQKDKRGLSALAILLKKTDPALNAFAQSFETKRTAASIPNFYNKRKIPKAKLADRSHLIEPETRPDDANETAEHSEFSD